MPTNFLWQSGTSNSGLLVTAFALMTTELEGILNAGTNISSVNGTSGKFTNSNTGQGMWADLFYGVGSPAGGTATAGANLTGWFLTSLDSGTTFETQTTGSSGVPPARPPDFIIPVATGSMAINNVYKSAGLVLLPALQFKVYVQNNTGATLGAGTTTVPFLKAAPVAMQY